MDAAKANKEFYDLADDIYEEADGRRKTIPAWLVDNISFCEEGRDKTFLDLGAGTGFITKIAANYFDNVWAMDISEKMLAKIPKASNITTIPCDITGPWPFKQEKFFDKIACVATLHHLSNVNSIITAVYDHLAEGGIFYTDLDIDKEFVRRWRWPLAVYRKLRKAAQRYSNLCPQISDELFNTAEAQSEGIDLTYMIEFFKTAGFLVVARYHWGNNKAFPRGLAPFVSLWVVR